MGQQQELMERYRDLQDWYQSIYFEKRIASSGGGTLRVAFPKNYSGNSLAVVVSGRSEYIEKYFEFARDLHLRGIATVLYDHCGQGDSDRQLADHQKGYIDSFQTYVRDLEKVIETAHKTWEVVPVNLISHSMGGTVATLFGLRYPERVKKMVLSSPMCAIITGSRVPQFLIKPITAIGCHLGFGDHYMPSKGPYQPHMAFNGNPFTSDENRFKFNQFLTNSLDFAPLGGPTFRWLHEAYKAMRTMSDRAEQFLCPHLSLTAGDDRIIKTAIVKSFCDRSLDGIYEEYKDVRHELFMEIDPVRDDVLSKIAAFLAADR